MAFVIHYVNVLGTLYVNAALGSTEASCGTKTHPCKYLQQAVQEAKEGGEVIIQGVQIIVSSIDVTKDISIIGQDGATITGSQPSLVAFNVNFLLKVGKVN